MSEINKTPPEAESPKTAEPVPEISTPPPKPSPPPANPSIKESPSNQQSVEHLNNVILILGKKLAVFLRLI